MRSSLDSLVGQLFIIGLTGLEVDSRLEEHYSRCPSGGFILFGRNARDVGQLRKLTSALRDLASEHSREYGAPLIGIDQEGGVLSPLRDMVTSLPGNMGLAATGSPEAARYAGYVTGRDLTSLGIGLNFAPVLDLAREPLNPAIGTRSFGDEPHRVAEFGVAYANGLLDAGVLFVAKHFPGHGSVPEDSHFSLPECTTSKAELLREDLVPFREIARLPHAAMMAAHVRFPDLDPVRPASLSYPLVTRFLREELGFDGVVITDCLEMGGVRKVAEVPEAAVMAIEAGCDIVLVSHTPALQRAAFEAVRNAVSSGRISVRRVEESVATIRRWKEGLGGLALRGPVLPRTTGGLTPEDLGEQVVTFIQGDPEWPWAFGRSPLVL
ncbi:MAG: beta-N-acetylhexosaminidase, partial [Bacillota bacterium]